MTDVLSGYRAVRADVGLLDRSETGKLAVRGSDRYTWLQGMVSNDVRLLEQGVPRLEACILNATGHILTDLTLLDVRGDDPYLLIDLPRSNCEKIYTLLDRYVIMEDVEITDVSERLSGLSLQGPRAMEVWSKLSGAGEFSGHVRQVKADHTGSGGLDLYLGPEVAAALRLALLSEGVLEVGSEAQETLRVEAGIPKYGVDMDESVIALEANLGPTHISLTKGCYVGQEIIARIDSRGHTNRALTGMVIIAGDLPAHQDKIRAFPTAEEPSPRDTGWLTSVVASSPAADGRPIALGYVRHEHRTPGTRLHAGEGNREATVEVVALPFYSRP